MTAKKILIIDDEINILKSLKRILEDDYVIEVAQSVEEATKILENQKVKFDAILCDFIMPNMTGEDFYHYVSNSLPQLSKKIVFMTGGKYTGTLQTFFDNHINFCLAKPFTAEELIKAINRVLTVE